MTPLLSIRTPSPPRRAATESSLLYFSPSLERPGVARNHSNCAFVRLQSLLNKPILSVSASPAENSSSANWYYRGKFTGFWGIVWKNFSILLPCYANARTFVLFSRSFNINSSLRDSFVTLPIETGESLTIWRTRKQFHVYSIGFFQLAGEC